MNLERWRIEMATRLERPLLISRLAAGVILVAVPDPVAGLWLGRRSTRTRWFTRAVGARDLVLGIGQLRASATGAWRRAGGVADLLDAVIAIERAVVARRTAALIAVPALASALLTVSGTPAAPPLSGRAPHAPGRSAS